MDQSWTGRQKLTFAIGTLVMFTAAMGALSWFSRPYTDAAGGWLISNLGLDGAFWLVIGAVPVLWAIGWWFNRDSPPVVVPPKPLWFKMIGAIFLGVPAVCIAIFIALAATGTIR